MRSLPVRIAVVTAVLVAYYFVGNRLMRGPDEDPIFYEARCKRAALNAAKGTDYDPQLLAECREKGIIPPLTSPNGGN
jgi:hypothetical protein